MTIAAVARPAPYRFGPFVLDAVEWRLTRDGKEVAAQPAVLKLLAYLCDRPGALVTRHQILTEVWDATVGDAALSQMMRRLRVALDDDADAPRFLVTLPKRGYRFIHAVERVAPPIVTASARGPGRTPLEIAVPRPMIKAHEPGPPVSVSPASTQPISTQPISSRRGAGGLLGRAQEIAAIDRAFGLVPGEAGARLVTLHGPGGQGKTRLASAWVELRRRPSVFVDLVSVTSADGLLAAIAARLPSWSLPRGEPVEVAPVLGRQLSREPDTVLVLDNFEQLAAEAPLVEALLDEAKRLRVLVTSRVILATRRERVVPVGGLAVDDAVSLFRALRPITVGGGAHAEDARALEALARRLDGNPLAIELASARMPLLSAADILAKLEQRFELLRKRARGAPHRHDSLEATIAGSWELLSADARAALVACAVYPDPFSYAEVESLLTPTATPAFDRLQTLTEHALLHAEPMGDRRCVVLESVREWVRAQPEAAPLFDDAVGRFVARVRAETAPRVARIELGADRDADAMLLRDLLRLRTAHRYASARGWQDDAAALVWSIWCLLEERGPVSELTRMLNDLLDGDAAGLDPRLEVKLRVGRAWLAERASRKEEAERDLARALELAPAGSSDRGRAASALAFVLAERSRAKEALPFAEEGARIAIATDHATDVAKSHRTLEIVLRALGRAADADRAGARALAACTSPLQDRARAGLIVNAAVAAQRRYAFDDAERGYREALTLVVSLGARRSEGLLLVNLAGLLLDRGRFDEAEEILARADDVLFEVGDRRLQAILRSHRANHALYRGRDDEARALFRAHRENARETGHGSSEAYATLHLAILAWRAGDLAGARAELAEADRVLSTVDAANERNLAMLLRVGLAAARGDAKAAARALDASAPAPLVGIARVALGEVDRTTLRATLGAEMDAPIHRVLLELVRGRDR